MARAASTAEYEAAERDLEKIQKGGPAAFSERKLRQSGAVAPEALEGMRAHVKKIIRDPDGLVSHVMEFSFPVGPGVSVRDLLAQMPADLFTPEAPRAPGIESLRRSRTKKPA